MTPDAPAHALSREHDDVAPRTRCAQCFTVRVDELGERIRRTPARLHVRVVERDDATDGLEPFSPLSHPPRRRGSTGARGEEDEGVRHSWEHTEGEGRGNGKG